MCLTVVVWMAWTSAPEKGGGGEVVVCGQAFTRSRLFAQMKRWRLYNHVVAFSLVINLTISAISYNFLLQCSTSMAMVGATGDGDGQWMRINDTHFNGLGLTDPIKNIEASWNNVPLHRPPNPSRINGYCCPPFSR